jgi:hypothetical protein
MYDKVTVQTRMKWDRRTDGQIDGASLRGHKKKKISELLILNIIWLTYLMEKFYDVNIV